MNTPDSSPPAASETELPWHPITELEIERSIRTAKGTTAPGEDNLPMLIWKKTWGHLKSMIVGIFTACLELGYHPKQWRSAKIIVLTETRQTRLHGTWCLPSHFTAEYARQAT